MSDNQQEDKRPSCYAWFRNSIYALLLRLLTRVVKIKSKKMFSAIIGLVGVIIGALTSIIPNYLHQQSENKKEKQKYNLELKKAARLIDADLWILQARTERIIEKPHWGVFGPEPYKLESWEKYHTIIAAATSNEAWSNIMLAITTADSILRVHRLAIEHNEYEISGPFANGLNEMVENIKVGRFALISIINSLNS